MDFGIGILVSALLLQGAYPAHWAALCALLIGVWAARRAPLALGPTGWWLPWLGWSVIAAAASAQPWAGVPVVVKWGALLLFFASACAAWRERERELWLGAVLAAGAVLAVAGTWTGWRAGHHAAAYGLLYSGTSRYYGYTAFAVLAAAAAGLGAAAYHGVERRWRAVGAAAAAIGSVYIVGVRSRGALLGLLVAVAVVAARRLGARKAALALGAALAGLAIIPVSRGYLLKSDSRLQWGRVDQWRSAVAAVNESPLHGWGPGNYRLGYLRHPVPAATPVRFNLATDYAHSEVLQAAAETGWTGLTLWLLGLAMSLAALLRPRPEPAAAGATAAAAGMAAMLLVDNVLQVPALGLLFFSALACAGEIVSPWRIGLPRKALLFLGLLPVVGALAPLARDSEGGRTREERVWLKAHALSFYPADPDMRADLALLYEENGAFVVADEQWAAAQVSAPFNAVYAFRRGLLAQRRGDWGQAERQHARAVELEPAFRDARLGLAVALWGGGKVAAARAELATAKALADIGPQGYAYADIVASRDPAALARVETLLKKPSPSK